MSAIVGMLPETTDCRFFHLTKQQYKKSKIMTSVRLKSKTSATVFTFFRNQITLLRQIGKEGTAATYQQTLNSIMSFRHGLDMTFDDITPEFALAYEVWLRSRHLCRNTTSFYMRILRTVYNKAAEQRLASVDSLSDMSIQASTRPANARYLLPTSGASKTSTCHQTQVSILHGTSFCSLSICGGCHP